MLITKALQQIYTATLSFSSCKFHHDTMPYDGVQGNTKELFAVEQLTENDSEKYDFNQATQA